MHCRGWPHRFDPRMHASGAWPQRGRGLWPRVQFAAGQRNPWTPSPQTQPRPAGAEETPVALTETEPSEQSSCDNSYDKPRKDIVPRPLHARRDPCRNPIAGRANGGLARIISVAAIQGVLDP